MWRWRFNWCKCRAGICVISAGVLLVIISFCGWWLLGLLGCALCCIGTAMCCRR